MILINPLLQLSYIFGVKLVELWINEIEIKNQAGEILYLAIINLLIQLVNNVLNTAYISQKREIIMNKINITASLAFVVIVIYIFEIIKIENIILSLIIIT
jgi:Na+-driven multidrug efflux pump